MQIRDMSPIFVLADEGAVARTRDFYTEHLGADVVSDRGWYVSLRFPGSRNTIQFLCSAEPGDRAAAAAGVVCSFRVDNVEKVYRKLSGAGLEAVEMIADLPQGNRGFAVEDPNGIRLYFYSEEDPDDYWIRFSH